MAIDDKAQNSNLVELSQAQVWAIHQIERTAIASFQGSIDELEAAIGMLRIGHHLGWKPLALVHNKRTIRKYEEILSINIREMFPEEGPLASRAPGYVIAKEQGYWKAVSGDLKSDELKACRREMV